MKTRIALVGLAVALAIVLAVSTLSGINAYRRDGEVRVRGFEEPVVVYRDEYGVPYVYASNLRDLIRGQGFVMAQDRLFILELFRALSEGRYAELVGEGAVGSDVTVRVLGIPENGRRHLNALKPEVRAVLGQFAEGINAFVLDFEREHPLELRLLSLQPRPWSELDLVRVLHAISYNQDQNLRQEWLSQLLIEKLGYDAASELFSLNVNPDRAHPQRSDFPSPGRASTPLRPSIGRLPGIPVLGSNNWVVGPSKSESGAPIVVNDPHLDARVLPGPWYPIGLFSPEVRAVGATLPGIPGLVLGRNEHVAFGVTNDNADSQDLYLETVDPERPGQYLDGEVWRPFDVREEVIRVRDTDAESGYREHPLTVRSTRRGPVVSDHPLDGGKLGPSASRVLSLRWDAAENPGPALGIDRLFLARNVDDVEAALADMDLFYFNVVYADRSGKIGHRATGRTPRRADRSGALPAVAPSRDDWVGRIPSAEMPGQRDPQRGWLATANHDIRPDGYPYYYSGYFAQSYRYERIRELLSGEARFSVEDHWRFLHDTLNVQARRLTPIFVAALREDERFRRETEILDAWRFDDRADAVGPTLYHALYERLVYRLVEDELGAELANTYIYYRYYWGERLDAMLESDRSTWFDRKDTPQVETRADLIRSAAAEAFAELRSRLGDDVDTWKWGRVHTVAFVSPLREEGFGRDLLGAGAHPLGGSGETVSRARYYFDGSWGFDVVNLSSLRFVADLADDEKAIGVISGGVAARQWHPNQADQVGPWLEGVPLYWWLSDAAVRAHAEHELRLVPR